MSTLIYTESSSSPLDHIAAINASPTKPPVPSQPSYGIDSPLGLVFSNALSPLYLYATLKGKHDLWSALLSSLPETAFAHPTLDAGCGRGMVLLQVARRKQALGHSGSDMRSYGIDIFARDQTGNAPEATWQNVAAAGLTDSVVLHTASFTETLPFNEGVFGVVTSSLAVHNTHKEGRRAAVKEMARVCRPGGWLVLVDLAGYVGGYEEVLKALGWTEVASKWGGAGVMFGMWPCMVLKARKPE
ncbi:putative methyltransferase [Mycena pura]|uniref:Methyltransferase n=1 Tax=Mycena pura TaxID=153505 RepID=A0AAD6V765_9AGAR|nr:putative methyltransferase [Mycena pura]